MQDFQISLEFLETVVSFAFAAFDSPSGESVGARCPAPNASSTLQNLADD